MIKKTILVVLVIAGVLFVAEKLFLMKVTNGSCTQQTIASSYSPDQCLVVQDVYQNCNSGEEISRWLYISSTNSECENQINTQGRLIAQKNKNEEMGDPEVPSLEFWWPSNSSLEIRYPFGLNISQNTELAGVKITPKIRIKNAL